MSVKMQLSWEPGGALEVDQAEALAAALQGWGREPGSFRCWSRLALRQTSS